MNARVKVDCSENTSVSVSIKVNVSKLVNLGPTHLARYFPSEFLRICRDLRETARATGPARGPTRG